MIVIPILKKISQLLVEMFDFPSREYGKYINRILIGYPDNK